MKKLTSKTKKAITRLKAKIGNLQMQIFALTPYADYPEVEEELLQLQDDLATSKDVLAFELAGGVA